MPLGYLQRAHQITLDALSSLQRLATAHAKDPERYKRLFTIVQDEMVAKTHTGSSSCTKGLLWLKR